MKRFIKGFLATVALITFSGLYSTEAQTTYTIGGSVSGLLSGKSVTLLNNGSDPLLVSSNGSFVFSNSQAAGQYAVTVAIQPAGQSCSVTNGSGPSISSNVTDVNVTCSSTFTVGGTVSGLAAPGLVLKLNNSATKIIASGASSYAFSTSLPTGAPYAVSVGIQPAGYSCTVINGTGTIGGSVTNANVNCEKTYTVGGSISGLTASGLILKLNGAGTKIVSNGAGSYLFSTALTSGTNYAVTIQSQPSGLTCLVLNGSGIISNNVTDANISCTVNTYTVGGTVSGLGTGLSLTLLNNGGNAVTVNESGSLSFTFTPALASGAPYEVTVGTQPSGQTCTVTGGSGNIGTTDVSVSVTCTTIGTPLNANIILGAPTTNSISMKLFTPDQSGNVSVSYGTSPGSYSTTTAPAALVAGTPLAFNLSGLNSDTQYYYRLNFSPTSGGSSQTTEYQFHTARQTGSSFTFTIQADSHLDDKSDINVYTQTLQNIAGDKPDFHIDLGDTFMEEKFNTTFTGVIQPATTQDQVNTRYKYELTNFGKIANTIPLFLVNGNHDAELGWITNNNNYDPNLRTWAALARTTYFNNPTPNAFYSGETASIVSLAKASGYYAWKWGDALFIALDPFWNSYTATGNDIWNLTLGITQYQWLQSTLAANAGVKYKFIFMHNLVGGLPDIDTTTGLPITGHKGGSMRGGIEAAVMAEWGGNNYDGTYGFTTMRPASAGWIKPIHQLLKDYGVTAVFHGHDHLYADQVLDGIKYQEVPQPSSIYQANSNMLTLAKEGGYVSCLQTNPTCSNSSGYLRITVSPTSGVTSEYVKTFVLPSQGANKTVDKTWNVPAPNTSSYAVGGTINGLNGTVTLLNNGGNSLSFSANGNFNFTQILPTGTAYAVTVSNQPIGQTCNVTNGTGNVGNSNVTSVVVTCTANTYTVSGTISGHTGTVTLTNNGGNAISIPAGTNVFSFPAIAYGSGWNVVVTSSPSGQTCSVSNSGTGSNITDNVSNVSVTCDSATYSVGGTISGLNGTVTLQNNLGNDLTISADGTFTFTTPITSGASFSVTVAPNGQPAGQTCLVINGSGKIGSGPVTNVSVSCSTNTYTVSGSVSGLGSGLSVTLLNNGGDQITLSSNSNFTFPTPLASGGYAVTVAANGQPTGQTCQVSNGTGTNISANVSNISVSCSFTNYSIKVKVQGLGTNTNTKVTLANTAVVVNGSNTGTFSESITVAATTTTNVTNPANPAFVSRPIGTTYAITVQAQPSGRACVVTNGQGTLQASITVNVVCGNTSSNATVGGSISGLNGTLTMSMLANSSTQTVNLVAGGSSYTFPTGLVSGTSYTVSISSQPTNGQTCAIATGSDTGTISSSNVINVNVTCIYPNGVTVSGTVTGHNGPITLTNNGINSQTVQPGSINFSFPAQNVGTNYNVVVATPPPGQTCLVANGSGTNIQTNVTSVSVNCYVTYTVGGSVSGLSNPVTLSNNGNDSLAVSTDGSFTFSNALNNGSAFTVAVQTQPVGQTCLVFNASGSIAGSNITNVLVSCNTNTYTVGGNVSGLTNGQSIILLNNSGNALNVNANGSFTFTTPLAAGPYIVTVGTQPAGQTCSVTNGSGNVSTSNITSVVVTCTNNIGGCSSPANASAPGSDPFWAIYSSPTLPDAETTPTLDSEQSNPFEACLGSG